MTYMTVEDEHAFDGIPLKEPPDYYPNRKNICPQCKGHGKWNLELNPYGEGRYFQASCSQCWGWGYVEDSELECIHDYDSNYKNIGRCLHIWKCRKCGKKITVDSSD